MIYSDFNVHLCAGNGLSSWLKDDFTLAGSDILERSKKSLALVDPNLQNANLMLFNLGLCDSDIKSMPPFCSEYFDKKLFLTLLASPDRIDSYERLYSLKLTGLASITFHSHHQSISKSNYTRYANIALWAEKLKMPILVDGSYGTLDMYNIDNLEFVSYLASLVKDTPIVIMHSGGSRILEAMLLVESTSNLYLETSFTLPYYIGSSIENDLAFAYKKIGPEKVVHASDHPYISHEASLTAALKFFDKYDFSFSDQEWIFQKTFSCIFKN